MRKRCLKKWEYTRELVPKGHSKGSGIDFLVDYLNIEKENTFAFGDSNNDIKGAKEAGIAFLGVTYGFGLKREIKYEFDTVDKVENIIQFFA